MKGGALIYLHFLMVPAKLSKQESIQIEDKRHWLLSWDAVIVPGTVDYNSRQAKRDTGPSSSIIWYKILTFSAPRQVQF